MGADRARWPAQSSKLMGGVTSLSGGFDSHAPSPLDLSHVDNENEVSGESQPGASAPDSLASMPVMEPPWNEERLIVHSVTRLLDSFVPLEFRESLDLSRLDDQRWPVKRLICGVHLPLPINHDGRRNRASSGPWEKTDRQRVAAMTVKIMKSVTLMMASGTRSYRNRSVYSCNNRRCPI